MTIFTKIKIDSTEYKDYKNLTVRKSLSKFNSSSNYSVELDSPFGRHATDFVVGDEVEIQADDSDLVNSTIESNTGGSEANSGTNATVWLGQTWTLGTTGVDENYYIKTLKLKLSRIGTPGTMTVGIRTVDGLGDPTGDDLSIGTIDGDSLTTDANGVWYEISMSAFQLQASTQYSIVIRTPDAGADQVRWKRNSSGYTGGIAVTNGSSGVGAWNHFPSVDFIFEVIGFRVSARLLLGILEKIRFDGRGTHQTVTLSGRDYSARLQDATVVPAIFSNAEVSTIVTTLLDDNVSDITQNNINVTTTTLGRISFNQVSVFDALTQLAQLSGFEFYVDNDKDLHFEIKANTSSGVTLDNTNILNSTFNQTREDMANSIWVYGDRYLAGTKEELVTDGGSIFTLLNEPHNIIIEQLGSSLKGGIFGLTAASTSGNDYLVNFFDKQVIFQSGTLLGYDSTPAAGGSLITNYDREIPIVKFGEDLASIDQYGKKVKIIDDKTIKDPQTATDILNAELENVNPFKGVEVNIKGWQDLTVGNTAKVTLSDFGIDDTVSILDVTYFFNKNTIQLENVIKIRLNNKIKDITDEFVNLRKRLNAIEGRDRQQSDVITRLMTSTGSALIVGSYWAVSTRTMGSSFVLGGKATGSVDGIGGIVLGTLGSSTGSVSFLGDSRTALSIITSGGFF